MAQFPVAGDYMLEAQQLERRRKMADALRAQSMDPLQSQTAGGYVVPISPLQGIAKLAQAFSASRMDKDADARMQALNDRMQSDRTDTIARALQASQGRTAIDAPSEDLGGGPGRPAIPANPQEAFSILAQSRDPMLQQFGTQAMLQGMRPREPKMQRVEIPDGQGGKRVGFVDMNSPNPMATFQEGGVQPAKPEMVNTGGQVVPVNPYAQTGPLQVTAAPGAVPFSAQGMTPEQFREFQTKKAAAGAARITNNNMVSTEKKYGEQFAGKIADADVGMRDAAIKAPELARRAVDIKKILADGNVATGLGADFKLIFGKAAAAAGVKGADDYAANTEVLATSLAQNTLDAIKSSGLGSGTGFSNADRDFLEKAVGGKISLEGKTIGRLADLAHRAATLSADRWNKRVKAIPKSALEGTGISTDSVSVPGLPAQQMDRSAILNDARSAIQKGAPKDKVLERLKQLGIENPGL